ncbi:hypothetical protein [Kutzneria buriramensis]|uniref:Uncharacterized protein n=1 Tax=Kutzneria buriramensis TaxID=1045776 RepID=A0A3E0IA78_9PSEU|nr:hypothetical protein [Kutzneria buriramensis]REH55628.1 hypothetical protein BCF44_101654 [Kutzneria buriramensis]
MSDDQWETTAWESRRDPWFSEPVEWPTRQPALPAWSARDFEQQLLIPLPRRSTEWL